MAGNTARIDSVQFRLDWGQHIPIAALCVRYTITKDQVVRLRNVWRLPLRLDRSLRFKPPRPKPPTPEEVKASESSLALSPCVAAMVTCVQARWTAREWEERQVSKAVPFSLKTIAVNGDLLAELEDPHE
jgi:hypothetical protein